MYYTTLQYANFPQRSSVLGGYQFIAEECRKKMTTCSSIIFLDVNFDGIMEPSQENAENSEPTRPNVNNHTPEQTNFFNVLMKNRSKTHKSDTPLAKREKSSHAKTLGAICLLCFDLHKAKKNKFFFKQFNQSYMKHHMKAHGQICPGDRSKYFIGEDNPKAMEAMKEKLKLDISSDSKIIMNLEATASPQTVDCDSNTQSTEENLFGNADESTLNTYSSRQE